MINKLSLILILKQLKYLSVITPHELCLSYSLYYIEFTPQTKLFDKKNRTKFYNKNKRKLGNMKYYLQFESIRLITR